MPESLAVEARPACRSAHRALRGRLVRHALMRGEHFAPRVSNQRSGVLWGSGRCARPLAARQPAPHNQCIGLGLGRIDRQSRLTTAQLLSRHRSRYEPLPSSVTSVNTIVRRDTRRDGVEGIVAPARRAEVSASQCTPQTSPLPPARLTPPRNTCILHVLRILRVLRVLHTRHPGLPRTPQVPSSVPARPARAYLPARHTARHTHHRVRRARSVGAPVQQSPACHRGPVSRWCPLLVPLRTSLYVHLWRHRHTF